jgi:integral membrane protein (TIGR00529 family)
MPVLIKILIIFAFILVLIKKKLNIGLSLILASFLFWILFQIPLSKFFSIFPLGFFAYENTNLLLSVFSIMLLGNLLSNNGELVKLVQGIEERIRDSRLVSPALSALIGFLPMPGGALFSAPLIEASYSSNSLSSQLLTFINYWYRHVWEYFLPLYPVILMASTITGLSLAWIIIHHLPFTILALIGGWLVIKNQKPVPNAKTKTEPMPLKTFLRLFIPILIPVFVVLLNQPVWLGAAMGIVFCVFFHRMNLSTLSRLMFHRFSWAMMLDVVGVILFKTVIIESGSIPVLVDSFLSSHFPILIIGMVIPFLIALISGYSSAFIGIAFPIILPLFTEYSIQQIFPLIFISGYAGITFSPAHLCLILTCRHFKSDLISTYRQLFLPFLLVFSWGVIWFFLAR